MVRVCDPVPNWPLYWTEQDWRDFPFVQDRDKTSQLRTVSWEKNFKSGKIWDGMRLLSTSSESLAQYQMLAMRAAHHHPVCGIAHCTAFVPTVEGECRAWALWHLHHLLCVFGPCTRFSTVYLSDGMSFAPPPHNGQFYLIFPKIIFTGCDNIVKIYWPSS